MTKTDFAKKILKCTHTHWYGVLSGKKNLGYEKASVASQVLGTERDLWIDPNASVNDRCKAWKEFAEGKA